ncbi:TetR/AcrR family transcriptional regulator [Novacetimonas hansenii]|uniref:TetR/AcrR family transcriptional regulator n=1 Tax=Novacetimonas hansenii TaxID=436 RepID=UPI000789BD0B|nr:TetR/AcrR family transcriptional regulator [Novacetimonas hansenii]MBL7238105.1 TetR family transcriptional regulator [Novacetimonas hansenii]PYD73333.1 TetR family transcriptional regulator [Novacetimonas hansenii]RFP02618.1 TetR family transcriptional regulator [Novacetimonas hansenii]WEQ58509.1 TetR/AcrR family transcriptional regulator [Novacetimonas hansenii]CUW48331.1 transcriptional regulator BetI [Novacetimonas hansenii]
MARPKTIDRENVLHCAEQVVQRSGAAALTLDAVARQAGITKGGLQYCFGNKDDLIAALVERWIAAFDMQAAQYGGPDASPMARVRAYVRVCSQIDDATRARMAGMLVTLLQSPRHLHRIRQWYAGWFSPAATSTTHEVQRLRTMLFAAEGAFLLRTLGFIDMAQAQWDTVFADIQAMISPAVASPAPAT